MAREKRDQQEANGSATAVAERTGRRDVVRADEVPDLRDYLKEVVTGNIRQLTPDQQAQYVLGVCKTLGLNPATGPLEIITFKGRTVLYAKKDCTEQLRRLYGVSVQIVAREQHGKVYAVTARASLPNGRLDESIGAVCLDGLAGEDLANAVMKAETKAKRRVTLSICGLGCLDESEVDATPAELDRVEAAARAASPVAAQAQPASEPASESYLEKIEALAGDVGWSNDKLADSILKKFGLRDLRALTGEQAAKVIAGLEQLKAKAGGAR